LASKRPYSAGIDWMEVTVLMNALESLHAVDVSLVMSLDSAFVPYRMQVVAIATKKGGTSGGVKQSVSLKRFFPSADAGSMDGLCFRLLHELDHECSKMWRQESFT
jgi:hypothetical protein